MNWCPNSDHIEHNRCICRTNRETKGIKCDWVIKGKPCAELIPGQDKPKLHFGTGENIRQALKDISISNQGNSNVINLNIML